MIDHRSCTRRWWRTQTCEYLKDHIDLIIHDSYTQLKQLISRLLKLCLYNSNDQLCFHIFLHNSKIWFFIFSFAFFTFYGYITNSQSDQLSDGLIAQLVEHCTGITEVWITFKRGFFFCLSCVYNCNDQSCLCTFSHSSNIWTFIYSLVHLFTVAYF